jgi:hypothetical protein
VNVFEAETFATVAARVNVAAVVAGTTQVAENTPAPLVRMEMAEDPAVSVPVVFFWKPLPLTATEVPTGPDEGDKVTAATVVDDTRVGSDAAVTVIRLDEVCVAEPW